MADTYDIVSLAEAKLAVNVEAADTAYDDELAAIVTASSQRIVDACGPVVNRTFTAETYDGGGTCIMLRNAAIGPHASTTIASLAEYDTAGTATTLSAEDYDTKPTEAYIVDPETGTVWRRQSGTDYAFYAGRRNVVATYTSGRGASTAAVPPKFKTACALMVAHLWRQRGPQAGAFRSDVDGGPVFGVASFALPKAVKDLLSVELRPDRVFGIA